MPTDVAVVVADASRLAAIRESVQLPGRLLHFNSGSVASAMESIRAYQANVVAVDAVFAQTPAGVAFIERVEALDMFGTAVKLIVQVEGRWIVAPRGAAVQPPLVAPVRQAPTAPKAVVTAAPAAVSSTRRVPRFPVLEPLDAIVESGRASVVDLSVLGAQVVSVPVLRPRQKIKIGLPDNDDVVNVVAQVAWSTFERSPFEVEPHYRVGIEFAGDAQQVLEQYRLRHCGERPIPLRGR